MVMSLLGGALVGLAFIFIAALRGGAARTPKPFWARSEAIESMIAVLLVSMIALGLAIVVSSVKSGWIPLVVGVAVGFAGLIAAIMMSSRRTTGDIGPATKAMA